MGPGLGERPEEEERPRPTRGGGRSGAAEAGTSGTRLGAGVTLSAINGPVPQLEMGSLPRVHIPVPGESRAAHSIALHRDGVVTIAAMS